MTTKIRIITGFSAVILLLGVMAFFGLSSLKTASNNFVDYRRLASVNVNSSDLKSAIYEIVYYNELYLTGHDPANMEEAGKRVDNALEAIAETRNISRLEKTLADLSAAEVLLREMQQDLNKIQSSVEKVNAIFEKDCLPNMVLTDELLRTMGEGGRANASAEGLFHQTRIWQGVATVRENLMVFLASMDMNAAGNMLKGLDGTLEAIDNAGKTMNTPRGRQDHAAVLAAFQKVVAGFSPMVEAGKTAQISMERMKLDARKALELATDIDKISNELMHVNGAKTLESNGTAQTRLMGISVAGVLLGVAFAIYTIMMLVRTLGRMSVYASDIAEGNFNSKIRITEKGEIGNMFQAMRRIPDIFSGVISRCNDIANDISSGRFRDRLDTGQFSGGFRDLAQGINSIADSYTRSIDNLPVGIVALNSGFKTIFTNEAGARMVGEDAMRAFGGKMPFWNPACMTTG